MFSVQIPVVKNLRTQLERVTAAVNKNTPIETCVLIEATEHEGLTLTSVDSRTHQLRLQVPKADVFHEGVCIINADILNRVVKTFEDDDDIQLAVDADAKQLLIQSGPAKLALDLHNDPPEMFPVIRDLPDVVTTVDAERITEAVKKALNLTQKDEFITLVGDEEALKIYTRYGGRMFSRTILKAETLTEEWRVAIPMQLLARMPLTWTETAEIRLNDNTDTLVISCGAEHLLISRLATDTTSYLVDCTVDKKAERYWVIKCDRLLSDLRRAAVIRDRQGLRLERDRHAMRATYGAAARGSASTEHAMTDHDGDIVPMNLDPILLAVAARSLEAVDLVGEQVEEIIPATLPGQQPQRFYNLRLTDQEAPDYRAVIVTTLQTE